MSVSAISTFPRAWRPLVAALLRCRGCDQQTLPDAVVAAVPIPAPPLAPLTFEENGGYAVQAAAHLADLDGRIVADHALILVPTPSWHPREDRTGWFFTSTVH